MFTRPRISVAAALFCGLVARSAFAQEPAQTIASPANLAYAEGQVELVHEGVAERADPPVLLIDGDIVRTRHGPAEIVFAEGTLLHVDQNADLEILAPQRVRLLNGRLLVRVSAAATRPYFIDTPAATVRLEPRGEYGVSADQDRHGVEVTVARGLAEVDDASQRVLVRAGDMLSLAGPGARASVRPFNSARWDSFTQWSSDRTNGFSTARSSSQLPYELRPYGPVLDQYGRWDYMAPHGYVWFPAVAASWRPYSDGWWTRTRYGWTWYGRDRWAWPTHHYGRWGFNGSFWYWIPATRWGPAWVSWAFLPGYVSWAPLGWNGRAVIPLGARDHPAYWPNYDPWRAWTIVPRDHFGRRQIVHTHAIDPHRLDERTRRAMIFQETPPAADAGSAVPRGTLSAPGAAIRSTELGPMRRDETPIDRPGWVRRPSGATPGRNAASDGAASAAAPPRAGDAPQYAPQYMPPPPPESGVGAVPRSGGDSVGAGAVRSDAPRGGVRAAPERAQRPEQGTSMPPPPPPQAGSPSGYERRGGVRDPGQRSAPPPEAAPQRPPPDQGGAVERGGRSRGPAAGVALPAEQGGGGARRRPPA